MKGPLLRGTTTHRLSERQDRISDEAREAIIEHARTMKDVRQFVLDNLSANPAVATTQTSLVFEHSQGAVPWL